MGISGLLPLLELVTRDNHVSYYKNKTVAIDGYAWLHKAVYGCCIELATGLESDKWITYCLNLIDMLLRNGLIVHMVFDGANLPSKQITETLRASNRAAALEKGLELIKTDKKKSLSYLSSSIDVTPRMAAELMKRLRESRPEVPFLGTHDSYRSNSILCHDVYYCSYF